MKPEISFNEKCNPYSLGDLEEIIDLRLKLGSRTEAVNKYKNMLKDKTALGLAVAHRFGAMIDRADEINAWSVVNIVNGDTQTLEALDAYGVPKDALNSFSQAFISLPRISMMYELLATLVRGDGSCIGAFDTDNGYTLCRINAEGEIYAENMTSLPIIIRAEGDQVIWSHGKMKLVSDKQLVMMLLAGIIQRSKDRLMYIDVSSAERVALEGITYGGYNPISGPGTTNTIVSYATRVKNNNVDGSKVNYSIGDFTGINVNFSFRGIRISGALDGSPQETVKKIIKDRLILDDTFVGYCANSLKKLTNIIDRQGYMQVEAYDIKDVVSWNFNDFVAKGAIGTLNNCKGVKLNG